MAQKKESLDELYQQLNIYNQYAVDKAMTEDIIFDLESKIEQLIFKKKYYELKRSALERLTNKIGNEQSQSECDFWKSMVDNMGQLLPYKIYTKEEIDELKKRVGSDHRFSSFKYHIERLEQLNAK